MKSYTPYTPSRRSMTTVDYRGLSRVRPLKRLLRRLPSRAGRNNQGRITTRHRGGGHKRLYRMIDFRWSKSFDTARVETIEYDPYRTAFIARIRSRNGNLRYILAAHGAAVGSEIAAGEGVPQTVGNRMKLASMLPGTQVHNVELIPGRGGQLVRSAGSYAEVLAHTGGYTDLKLPSGEIRKVRSECAASVGQVSNVEHRLISRGKAGRARWLGRRPTVRGSAMNPVDHPYGGGEGAQPRGTRKPKTLWGKVTGGRRTRNKKKRSSKLIIKRRK